MSQNTGSRPSGDPTGANSPSDQSTPITDELANIRWVETAHDVSPAHSAPAHDVSPAHSAPADDVPMPLSDASTLSPERVGRSAWDDELAAIARGEATDTDSLPWISDDDGPAAPVEIEPDPFLRLIKEWGPVVLAAIAIALFTRLTLVQAYHIPSLSMAPTLDRGDRVVVNRLSYRFGEIERGQVVVFSTPPSQQSNANDIIKRVIALPGETIEFRDGEVFVDGLLAQEPYLARQGVTRPRQIGIPGCAQDDASGSMCVVPDDHVFVMGDNREGSEDSRRFGPIPTDTIVGRAMVRVWPLNDIGQL